MDLYIGDFPDYPVNNQTIGWTFVIMGLLLSIGLCVSLRNPTAIHKEKEKEKDEENEGKTLPRYNPYMNPMSTSINPNIKIRMNAPFCAAVEMISADQ